MKKPVFELSKLSVMAIRGMDWCFSIMPCSDEFGKDLDLNFLATKAFNAYLKERSLFLGKIIHTNKTYSDFEDDIKQDFEYNKQVSICKSELKNRLRKQYKLIWTDPSSGGMYKDYEFVIMDNSTGKLYNGKCDNYCGQNWPPVKFYIHEKQIEHISDTLDGWFNFKNLYRDIAEWIPDGGTWVEVGVYSGKSFSFGIVECLNRGKSVDMVAVDIFPDEWIYSRSDGPTVREKFDTGMAPLNGHYRVMAKSSVEAAQEFEDGSIDFVFIDAAHDYDNVTADLTAWVHKVRPGGIIAGHDYDEEYKYHVVKAVDDFFGDKVQKIVSDDQKHLFCWKVQL